MSINTFIPSDYGYSSHRRSVSGIAGLNVKGEPFVFTGTTAILENRVNGRIRSVTVLSDLSHVGRKVVRLTGESARY